MTEKTPTREDRVREAEALLDRAREHRRDGRTEIARDLFAEAQLLATLAGVSPTGDQELEMQQEAFIESLAAEVQRSRSGPIPKPDRVKHPKHYTSHPSGVECIEITKDLPTAWGSAIKYLWRVGLKEGADDDLDKALQYIGWCDLRHARLIAHAFTAPLTRVGYVEKLMKVRENCAGTPLHSMLRATERAVEGHHDSAMNAVGEARSRIENRINTPE